MHFTSWWDLREDPLSSPTNYYEGVSSLIPAKRGSAAVLRHPGLEEVLLLAQVDGFAHPGEGVACAAVLLGQADALQAAVRDVLDVLVEEVDVQAHHAVRQAVGGVGDFQNHG